MTIIQRAKATTSVTTHFGLGPGSRSAITIRATFGLPVLIGNTILVGMVAADDFPSGNISGTSSIGGIINATGTIAGGSLSSRTYYIKATYVTVAGETAGGGVSTQAIAASHLVQVTVSNLQQATGFKVYASTSPTGPFYFQGGVSGSGTWTEPTSGLITSGPVPSTVPAFDSIGNVYHLALWQDGDNPAGQNAMGICYANVTIGGSPTVTFQFAINDSNPLFNVTTEANLFIAEVGTVPITALVSSGFSQQTSNSPLPCAVTLIDNNSVSVTTNMGNAAQVSAGVACLQVAVTDEIFVAIAGGYSTTPTPTLTGAAYTLIDSRASGLGFLSYWFSSIPSVPPPPPADALPILRNTTGTFNAQVLYEFTRTVSFFTTVTGFMSAAEQRWPNRAPLNNFDIPMSNLEVTDKASWLTYFNSGSVKGRFGQDLQITLHSSGVTYSDLTLMSDSLAVTNTRANLFDQDIKLRQVKNPAWTPPTPITAYPVLSFGASVEQPFVQSTDLLTGVVDNPTGPRYVYGYYGFGLTDFPTGFLRSWKITYSLLSDADMATLEAAFISVQGRVGTFQFTDPLDGNVYQHVRFDQDDLVIKYITKNQKSTEVTLIQMNG